jgi:hypothetical protein
MKHSGTDNPIEECGALASFDFTPWIDDGDKSKWMHPNKLQTDEMHIKTFGRDQLLANETVIVPLV